MGREMQMQRQARVRSYAHQDEWSGRLAISFYPICRDGTLPAAP
jgi:hypothetical protein